MIQLRSNILLTAVLMILGVFILSIGGSMLGLIINTTDSAPHGFYRLAQGSEAYRLKRGDYVAFCLSEDQYTALDIKNRKYIPARLPLPWIQRCAFDLGPLLKNAVGLPGDTVEVSQQGVRINGNLLANSKPKRKDAQGRALPHREGFLILGRNEYWFHLPLENSLDSRYYGPVQGSDVKGKVDALLTF